jgi:hypothetical protein
MFFQKKIVHSIPTLLWRKTISKGVAVSYLVIIKSMTHTRVSRVCMGQDRRQGFLVLQIMSSCQVKKGEKKEKEEEKGRRRREERVVNKTECMNEKGGDA